MGPRMNFQSPAARGHARTFLCSLALGLAVAACGGDSSGGGGGQSGVTGEEVAKPGGGTFFVDPNESGSTSRLRIAEMFWARLVDVHDIDAVWIDEEDPYLNPMGVMGIGEIGIVGTAAAVANATYHATGRRIRDLPITPSKLVT